MEAMTTIKIPVEDGTSLPAYLARPATRPAPTGVIVVHELFGVNPDIRGVTDDLAGAGYLSIAPEFYHRDAAPGRWAVQFHPESILTAAGGSGHQIIANVLALCRARTGG